MKVAEFRISIAVKVLACAALLALGLSTVVVATASHSAGSAGPNGPNAVFTNPTYSSPIAVSNGNGLVWSVNPDDDSVSVIDAGLDVEIARIRVGKEPQSIALDPNNAYAYVANAADNTVTVIRILGANPASFSAAVETSFTTGAEPWNIVVSPDGKRVFVANSAQDTLTVIKSDVTFPTLPSIIGNVDLAGSACNAGDPNRHFQPRGLAVTSNNAQLYVTRFLSFVRPGGTQGTNTGKEGLVCRLDINTSAATIGGSVTAFTPITLTAQSSGFGGESAYPNQMQSIVIRGTRAYLPNIAAAPAAPLKFNNDTHAFVNVIDGVTTGSQTDGGALNLHLGARVPEPGKTKLFFANPWAMVFTNQSGNGNAYVVSAASDLVVKLNVDASGVLAFTGGVSTTRYIDLNDPSNPTTSGRSAGKNPLGIAIRDTGVSLKVYVMNYVSRNISVIDPTDAVIKVINLTNLPVPNTPDEQLQVGKEIFFSSRGSFDRPGGTTVTTTNRLSSDGWQSCSSCHFAGLTDGNIWAFNAGPRKSVPLNGTWSPHNPDDQRLLNYSAIFDEVQDFELNIRNVSGPGPLGAPLNGTTFDPNHGLLISDTGGINFAPSVVNAFAKPNAGRPQHTVTLPGSSTPWPALDALKEWVRFGIRTPNGALTTAELIAGGGDSAGGLLSADVAQGRRLFFQAGCQTCHGGTKWTISSKDFDSPPAGTDIFVENPTVTTTVNTQYLNRFLKDINSFNLGVASAVPSNTIGSNIGAVEKAADGKDALGKDYNGDGAGIGYNVPSLLGIWGVPPYYHNGACETLACVLSNTTHRTANNTRPDVLSSASNQAKVVAFLRTLDDQTAFPTNLSIRAHDIFFNPPTVFTGTQVVVGANVSLFGTRADLDAISDTLRVRFTGPGLDVVVPLPAFNQDFGQSTVTTTWTAPSSVGVARVTVQADSTHVLDEANESDNTASRLVLVRNPPPDRTPPTVDSTRISDDTPFNDNDPIVTTANVKVRVVATDSGSPISGVGQYCIVRYYYHAALRRWVESTCTFQPIPTPDATNGSTITFTVNSVIPAFEGTAYAFVWVKDNAGNISRTPGFDVVSFIPAAPININRNDVRLFRILTAPSQQITMTFPIVFGDVDVSVFDGVAVTSQRIAISAQNGTLTETVSFTNTLPSTNKLFQVEVRAVVNSRFSIITQDSTGALGAAVLARTTPLAPFGPPGALGSTPFIAGPPALQTAIDALEQSVYLPMIVK